MYALTERGGTSLNNVCVLSLTLLCIFVERIKSDVPEHQHGKPMVGHVRRYSTGCQDGDVIKNALFFLGTIC